jgi:hypothetical protein
MEGAQEDWYAREGSPATLAVFDVCTSFTLIATVNTCMTLIACSDKP